MPHLFKTSVSPWVVFLAVVLSCSVTAEQRKVVKEPVDYRTSDYQSEVPFTVQGATVIDSAQQLRSFLSEDKDAVLLDVFPAPRKPDNLPANELWIEPERQTLPGAVWLANTGFGDLPEANETLLKKQLQQHTSGDKQRNVIIFCEPACWHSWNAAKRAASYGYSNIYWYRQGVTGWQRAGFPVKKKPPVRP